MILRVMACTFVAILFSFLYALAQVLLSGILGVLTLIVIVLLQLILMNYILGGINDECK